MEKNKIELKNGILIFGLIGGFFLLFVAIDQADNTYLRMLNFFFVGYGINRSISSKVKQSSDNYLEALASGMLTGVIGVLLSIIGLMAYFALLGNAIDVADFAPSFIAGDVVSVFPYCFALLIEGIASCAVTSLLLMQYWKKN
ncbi:MAG: hypothetical protein ACI8ZO_000812 [Flavobacteriales bacterium]|jgi:hypothetical protein